MGEDWAEFVCLRLYEQLVAQDAGTAVISVSCVGAPDLEARVREDSGAVTDVQLRLGLEIHVRDSSQREWVIAGTGTFSPGGVSFDIHSTDHVVDPGGVRGRMAEVLRAARALVARPENDFTWSSWRDAPDALGEIDQFLDRLHRSFVRPGEMEILFLPTGPMQELALSSGWGEDFLALADRFDEVSATPAAAFACRVCGRDVGWIEVDRASGVPEVVRVTFTGRLTQPAPEAVADRLAAAVQAVDAAAVHAIDPELAPFYCPQCDASYCGEHMQHWDVFDDEGFHDSIRGRCPEGHERMLED